MGSFGESKSELLVRYTLGTEQALARAGVLDTTELSVIQAFTIYLETMHRKKGMRAVWSLTGLLIRAAESMGLHRDGSHFAELSPFQVEMRRRVWWHICFIDSKVGDCQVSEVSISENIFDTQEPANLNDADIYPEMTTIPASRTGFTDLTACLIKCELWRSSRRIQSVMSLLRSQQAANSAKQEKMLDVLVESRTRIARNWLQNPQSDKPIYPFIKSFADINFADHYLVIHHRELFGDIAKVRTATCDRKQKFFLSALAGFERTLALVTQPATSKWGWIFHDQVQWPAISILLVQLCSHPWGPTCEHAWIVVQRMFSTFADVSRTQLLQPPLRSLIKTVQSHRAEEIQRLSMLPVATLQLGQLARSPSLFSTDRDQSCSDTIFDISAAEQRLQLERAVSAGEISPYLNPEISAASDSDVAIHWEAMWRDLETARIASTDSDFSSLFLPELWNEIENQDQINEHALQKDIGCTI